MKPEKFFQNMKMMDVNGVLTLPPNSFAEMDGEFKDYDDKKSITITFPIYEKYNNPAGLMLGGFLPVFFDLCFGPLSYLVAMKPTTSLDLNTTFIRPISVQDQEITVKASVVNLSKSYLIMDAEAWNKNNDLVGRATSRMLILNKGKN